jgi:hypothetical protein
MLIAGQLERLCIALRCTPNDLFDWEPCEQVNADKDHPLYALNRPGKVTDMKKILQSIPMDRLEEIDTLINERINPETDEKE